MKSISEQRADEARYWLQVHSFGAWLDGAGLTVIEPRPLTDGEIAEAASANLAVDHPSVTWDEAKRILLGEEQAR